jgi:hypothetical protein
VAETPETGALIGIFRDDYQLLDQTPECLKDAVDEKPAPVLEEILLDASGTSRLAPDKDNRRTHEVSHSVPAKSDSLNRIISDIQVL